MPHLKFAIIDSNILTCLGLKQLISDLLPMAQIDLYSSLSEMKGVKDTMYQHFFVSSRIYFENTAYFRNQPRKTIVLVNGEMSINGINTLNVCQHESSIVKDFMSLHHKGHGHVITMAHQHMQEEHPSTPSAHPQPSTDPLPSPIREKDELFSPRETEVAILLCKGYINKEIADMLNVSITTIITHRKNIMEKLHARSLADIIIYCVVNGIVNVEEL